MAEYADDERDPTTRAFSSEKASHIKKTMIVHVKRANGLFDVRIISAEHRKVRDRAKVEKLVMGAGALAGMCYFVPTCAVISSVHGALFAVATVGGAATLKMEYDMAQDIDEQLNGFMAQRMLASGAFALSEDRSQIVVS